MINYSIVLVALLIGQAEKTGEPALADKVKKLVIQLDHDDQAKRDAAEKAIIDLGPAALDCLPIADAKSSAELRSRLVRIHGTVEKQAIEQFTKPTVLTLQGSMKLADAIKSVEKQTGNTLVDFRERFNQQPDEVDVKVDFENVPFWEGMDKLLDAAGMTIYNYSDKIGELPFVMRGPTEADRVGRASYAGLFRIDAKSIEATKDLRNPAASALRVYTDIVWEPRIRPILLEIPLGEVKAIDENGNPIGGATAIAMHYVGRHQVAWQDPTAPPVQGTIEIPIEGTNSGVETDIRLDLPERSVKKIAKLSGKIVAVVPGRAETFIFANLAKAKDAAQQRGGVVVTLEESRKNEDVYEFRIRVKFDEAANALESHRGWIYNNECYLLDEKGEKIDNSGLEARLVEENEIGLSYLFDIEVAALAKCKFVYKTPAAIFKIPVDFELKDIDLP